MSTPLSAKQMNRLFYSDTPAVPREAFFGLAGLVLHNEILPALCGPMGKYEREVCDETT